MKPAPKTGRAGVPGRLPGQVFHPEAFIKPEDLHLRQVEYIFARVPLFPPAMRRINIHKIIHYSISAVWLANGLFCKILDLVPRHERIVARILGDEHARPFTLLIGLAETAMALWVLSGKKAGLNAIIQVALVAAMNGIEFSLAPDLLLWGRMNAFFALLFSLVVLFNTFYPAKTVTARA